MKTRPRNSISTAMHLSVMLAFSLFLSWGLAAFPGTSQALASQPASDFSLKGIDGKDYALSSMKECPLLILYFFDPDSRPCQEGIIKLNSLVKAHPDAEITVWAITASDRIKAEAFATRSGISFPVLLDSGQVSAAYNSTVILPTVYFIGPGLKVLDTIQGGGKGAELMMIRLAERELQRKNVMVAKAISQDVLKKDPDNTDAMLVSAYADLKAGQVDQAEKTFDKLAKEPGKKEVLGKEGLAAVAAKKGEDEKALKLASEVEKKAPERAYVHVIKGDILYAKGEKEQAKYEYKKAVEKKEAEPYHQAVRYNQLGRVYASAGKYKEARQIYDKAVAIDPYYVEGMANKAVTYEKEGRWDKALEEYRRALAVDRNDPFAVVLAKKAEEMLALQRDAERSKRIDRLVKELAQRYREQKAKAVKKEDTWTSRPMVLSFLDFQEKGGLSERDGFSIFFTAQLADYLNASGRVKVVERVILDKLLQELNLGSSELADPETALNLGRVLAAKLVGTGSFYFLPSGTMLSLRMIDTETSGIAMVASRSIKSEISLEQELLALNRKILQTIIEKYPLRGYVIQPAGGGQVLINIGANQGVVPGTRFKVITEGKTIVYKGRTLKGAPETIGIIEVVKVEPDLAYAKIVEKKAEIGPDSKIEEQLQNI